MSDGQKLDLQIKGLYTSPNNLSAVPQGAMEIADNVVINTKSIIDSRRGQTQYGSPLTIGSGDVNKLFNYASSLIVNYDDKMAYDSGGGTWVDYSGTYLPPSGFKIRSLEAQKNFYYTTDEGIKKLDSITSIPRFAGAPRALGGSGSTTGSSGFLLEDSAVAYRILWGYVDFNNNTIVGAPSERMIVRNPAGSGSAKDVNLTFLIPTGITSEFFYQIYRSLGTVASTDEPSDELQLVIEGSVNVSGSFNVLDQTPYALMGATLYTSPSQEGIANANYQPPVAADMDIFKGSAFYANVKQKESLIISLISVGEPSFGYVSDIGDTTNGSPVVTNIFDTSGIRVGMRVIGTGIPFNPLTATETYVLSVDSPTQVTLTRDATATNVGTSLEFQDRFTIDQVNYWAGTTQSVSTNTFEVETGGTPGQNINQTAINLVSLVNSSLQSFLDAYYISGTEDLPGKMQFVEETYSGEPFWATSTMGSSFIPALPESIAITGISMANPTVITTATAHGLASGDIVHIFESDSTPLVDGEYEVTVISPTTFSIPVSVTVAGTTAQMIPDANYVVSSNDERQNRVYISKPGQVEAVPLLNFVDVGSANFPILRVVALRDGIFFFKGDGIYRLSGETISNFTVNLVDNTVTLKGPETAVAFNNQVFCFTTQGVCAVTDSGVQIMSVPIENRLLEISSEQYTNFSSVSFGVAYESARQYLLFTVTETDDTFATQAFVYNSLTDTWTRWVMNRTCGVVNSSVNKLYMAQAATGQILVERKNYANSDYADEQYSVTISAVTSETEITLSDASNVAVGMTIVQNFRAAIVEEINGNDLTISAVAGYETGAAIVYTPILNEIQWAPIDAENPGILKQFSELSLFFRNAAFREIDASFSTNLSLSTEVVPIVNISPDGFGYKPWGDFAWGGQLGGQSALRTYVPRSKQRGAWLILSLKINEAFSGFSLQGVSLLFNNMSSRFK